MGCYINKYDFIIFDCDGVLFNSNQAKSLAFGQAVKKFPKDKGEQFVKYHQENGGVSRYVKFKRFITDFLEVPFNEEIYNELLKCYSDECKRIYKESDLTEGTEKLLEELFQQKKGLFVASGSDESELKQSFKLRGLDKYFKEIYGSPKTKIECVDQIMKTAHQNNGILIGDSMSDYKAAREFGLDFIFMKSHSEMNNEQIQFCEKEADKVIHDLKDLL
jgi:HAD superfamily hydrolase (TIGR01549 family)